MRTQLDPVAAVAGLGRIVTVWAHPDDESYLAAGVMSIGRWLGQSVTCVTATTGDFVASDAPRRTGELEAALDLLGVDDRVQLDLGDGRCELADQAAAIDAIAKVIDSRSADTVLTFGPDGLTGHADHRAVSRWTTAAVDRAERPSRLLYTTTSPDLHAGEADINDRFAVYEPGTPTLHDDDQLAVRVRLEGAWLDRKLSALQAHASQTGALIDAVGLDRYRRYIATEQFIDAANW
jgi:LmbE family N-acetylglucosaminyl deacetylase